MQKILSTELSGRSMAKAEVCKGRTRFTTPSGWPTQATASMSAELSAPMITRLSFSASSGQKRPAPQGRSSTRLGCPASFSACRASWTSRRWESFRARPS